MSATEAAQFNDLITAFAQNLQWNYSAMAATAFLAYDIFSTFTMEVEHIWKQRWTVVKALYIFSRYYGVLYLPIVLGVQTNTKLTVSFCKAYFYFYLLCGPVLFVMTLNVIFVIRLGALYNRSRKVLAGLIILLTCESVIEFSIAVSGSIHTSQAAIVAPLGLPFPGCLVTSWNTHITLGGWIPALMIASIFFAMTIYKFLQVIQDEHGEWHLSNLRELSPLIVAFVCDDTVFYFLTFAVLFFCMVVDTTFGRKLDGVGLPWIVSIYSLCASRLVLNIRHTAQTMHNDPGMTESSTLRSSREPAPAPFSRQNFRPRENMRHLFDITGGINI